MAWLLLSAFAFYIYASSLILKRVIYQSAQKLAEDIKKELDE